MVEKRPANSIQFAELAIGRFHALHPAGEHAPALGGMKQACLVPRRAFGLRDATFRPRLALGVARHEMYSDSGKVRGLSTPMAGRRLVKIDLMGEPQRGPGTRAARRLQAASGER